jgi:hypothetical protein
VKFGSTLRGIGAALATGFVLFFFSETMFWGRPGRASFVELVITWLAYVVIAGIALHALAFFRVRTLPAFFLCGALYGWLVEGVLAGTLYDAFPIQVSWTGLAWHALLSFCAGWYGLNVALRHSAWRTSWLAGALGIFWGTWAVMWWQPAEGGVITPLLDFALHSALNSLLVAAALITQARLVYAGAYRSRRRLAALIIIAAVWFGVVIAPQQPIALLIAPLLGGVTLLALRRSRRAESADTDVLAVLREPFPLRRCAALLAMPLGATLAYALFLQVGVPVATNLPIFWALTPLGFVLYGVSFWRSWATASGR